MAGIADTTAATAMDTTEMATVIPAKTGDLLIHIAHKRTATSQKTWDQITSPRKSSRAY